MRVIQIAGDAGPESPLPTVPVESEKMPFVKVTFLGHFKGLGPKESACASPCLAWSGACYLRRQQTSAQAGVVLPSSAPGPQP